MELSDEDSFSSGSEDQLTDDKKKRKKGEDHRGISTSGHHLIEEKPERKQREDKHRTRSEPQLSEDEQYNIHRRYFVPIAKRKSSSRIAADKIKKRLIQRKSLSRPKGYGLWEGMEEEMPTSSIYASRKTQRRSRPESCNDDEHADRNVKLAEHQLGDDKKERKADEDPGRSSDSDHLTEQKTERKQDEDKHRTSSSEDEADEHKKPVTKARSSSRITSDRKRVFIRNRSSGFNRGALRERLGEDSSSAMSRKRQGRSVQGNEAETTNREEGEVTERKRRVCAAPSDEDDETEVKKKKKGKCGDQGECNCGKRCRCKMCRCGKGMERRKKQTTKQE